jgi:DNA-binding IclR family transcriptional regulator
MTGEKPMEDKNEHRSTGRVLDVLELIASGGGGYTLTEICTAIDAPKSSMFPIIRTLLERDYLTQDTETAKYSIGPMAFQVGNAFLNQFSVSRQIENEMKNIVAICSETCHFATLVGGDVLYLIKIDSPEPIRMISSVGKRLPAYGTGLGKALLMDHTLQEIKRLYPDGLKRLTERTITDFNELEKQLVQARAEGVAYESEESNRYIRCVAAPIRREGRIIAAISVAIPTFRYTEEKGELIRQLLINAKTMIEKWFRTVSPDFGSED